MYRMRSSLKPLKSMVTLDFKKQSCAVPGALVVHPERFYRPQTVSERSHSVLAGSATSSSQWKFTGNSYMYGFLFVGCSVGALAYKIYSGRSKLCEAKQTGVFSRAEVAEHNTMEKGVYVIYKNNVYDITTFIPNHPGGPQKIILAAGGNLEPFWDMYAIHKKDEILEILQEYHIGVLRKEDHIAEDVKKAGPFANDPKRHPALIANSKEPYNAETPPALATDSFITPNELFFVRNHLPVPEVDVKDFRLEVEGPGKANISLTLDEVKQKFKKHSVTAALQCAGNRRSEMNKIKQVKGLSWSHNAISNAEWSGALLSDILLDAGIAIDDENIIHIQFEGLDKGPDGAPYGASIPADRIFNRGQQVLVAYEMNGKPLPRDHGFPLRIVAPGIVGARNVKWLNRIVASNDESSSHWQQNDYKSFSPNIDWDNVDFSSVPAIQELPVTSAICHPSPGSAVHEDEEEVTVKGYAYSGGGNGIIRVDVSCDGGKTWITAALSQSKEKIDRMYAWTLWEAVIPIPSDHKGEMEIVCKATDSSCNTQPEGVGPVWNLRGVLSNSWHRLNLKVSTEE